MTRRLTIYANDANAIIIANFYHIFGILENISKCGIKLQKTKKEQKFYYYGQMSSLGRGLLKIKNGKRIIYIYIKT